MPYANANPSSATANIELVGAPEADIIVVDSLSISSSSAQTVTLHSESAAAGTTNEWVLYVAANGGQTHTAHGASAGLFELTAATALTYTTSAAGNVFISVAYHTKQP